MRKIELIFATSGSRLSKKWKCRRWGWAEFAERCSRTIRTSETVAEYMRMSREEQSTVKDVGGFVGGYLRDGERKTDKVQSRSCATLDIDFGTPNVWDDFTLAYSCAAVLYSTHKHTSEKPRYRLIIPFSREVSPQEYEPICRRIADTVGIDLFDSTTYQLARLFYWPSTPSDGEWVYERQEGEPLDVDAVLSTYTDYRNAAEWPTGKREAEAVAHEAKKAGEPTEKPGLIGAFCRAYPIETAIEKFLSDKYEPTAKEGRYTYRLGSVAGGLVCYGGVFAYSHHDTDPARGLHNAFDLVRIHHYGTLDEGKERTADPTRLPSYRAMSEMAAADEGVRLLLAAEKRESAAADFAGVEELTEEDLQWAAQLEVDGRGVARSTINNMALAIENDPAFRGKLHLDDMRGCVTVTGGLPWDASAKIWGNRDDANLRGWLEKVYGMVGKDKVKDALDVVVTRHRVHPIRDYLKALRWDGVERLDRLIIDYLGAEDSELNRALTRIHFAAAVARVMRPGVKYDYCLILAGPQGVGKSSLIAIMGGEFYKDGMTSMEGKEGAEQIQGTHLVEIGELDAMKRSEISAVKQFITTTVDEFRPAYGQRKERVPRQCVFFGTTNERYFLKDETGNRRFPIIPIDPDLRKHGQWWHEELKEQRDQLWAEAVQRWRDGEKLYLSEALEEQARARQSEYSDDSDDPLFGLLCDFLEMKLPANWEAMGTQERRNYINSPDDIIAKGIAPRNKFCIPEFVCERMGRNMADKEYKYMARKIGRLMDGVEGWEKSATTRHAEQLYGRQRGYKRIMDTSSEDDL